MRFVRKAHDKTAGWSQPPRKLVHCTPPHLDPSYCNNQRALFKLTIPQASWHHSIPHWPVTFTRSRLAVCEKAGVVSLESLVDQRLNHGRKNSLLGATLIGREAVIVSKSVSCSGPRITHNMDVRLFCGHHTGHALGDFPVKCRVYSTCVGETNKTLRNPAISCTRVVFFSSEKINKN